MSAAQPTVWPQYRDMTAEQMLAWGTAESEARQAELSGVKSQAILLAAQANAEVRRKAIGASRSAAASMVIDSNRVKRRTQAASQEGGAL